MTEPPTDGFPSESASNGVGGPSVPTEVQRAAYALYALAALHLANMALGLLALDSTRATALATDPDMTEDELSSVVQAAIAFSVITALIFVVLYVLAGRKLLAGRTWGRTLGTVLAGLELIFGVLGLLGGALSGANLATGGNVTTLLITVAAVALSAAFLVWVWSRPSQGYFGADRLNGPPGQH